MEEIKKSKDWTKGKNISAAWAYMICIACASGLFLSLGGLPKTSVENFIDVLKVTGYILGVIFTIVGGGVTVEKYARHKFVEGNPKPKPEEMTENDKNEAMNSSP